MIKNTIPVIFCVFLCFIVSLIFTRLSNSWTTVDDAVCFECHGGGNPDPDGEIHSKHKDISCSGLCHEVIGDSPATSKCIVCHPRGDVGKCNLANFHDSDKGTDCLVCHTNCREGGTTTTTAPPLEHIEICLECHWLDDLHKRSGHRTCTQCHDTTDGGEIVKFYVEAGKCVVCHPMDGPGKCSLADLHGTTCLKCHKECVDETVTTTTTTMVNPLPPTIQVTPENLLRSRWIMLPALMFIEGDDTAFALFFSNPVYEPAGAVFPLPALILGSEIMVQPVLVNPVWLAGTEETQTVTVTVDEASDTIEISLLAEPLDTLNNLAGKP